jgi:hypothetical protein
MNENKDKGNNSLTFFLFVWFIVLLPAFTRAIIYSYDEWSKIFEAIF